MTTIGILAFKKKAYRLKPARKARLYFGMAAMLVSAFF
jgi:hypothetical protein